MKKSDALNLNHAKETIDIQELNNLSIFFVNLFKDNNLGANSEVAKQYVGRRLSEAIIKTLKVLNISQPNFVIENDKESLVRIERSKNPASQKLEFTMVFSGPYLEMTLQGILKRDEKAVRILKELVKGCSEDLYHIYAALNFPRMDLNTMMANLGYPEDYDNDPGENIAKHFADEVYTLNKKNRKVA